MTVLRPHRGGCIALVLIDNPLQPVRRIVLVNCGGGFSIFLEHFGYICACNFQDQCDRVCQGQDLNGQDHIVKIVCRKFKSHLFKGLNLLF